MQRLKNYAGFGVWFLGLGYIVMWLVTGPLNWPPLAHAAGVVAAIAALVHLLLIAVRSACGTADGSHQRPAPPAGRRREPAPTIKTVKARDHFGLRGIDR
jgi:hypothetical protein